MAFRLIKDIWADLRQMADRDIWEIADPGAPTSGTSGTGANFAGLGSVYTNTTNGYKYINTGTKASPTWSLLASSAVSIDNIIAAGTTTSGATTATAIAITGALAADIALVTWYGAPQTIAHIIAAATTTGIAVTFSTTVGTAGTIQYALVRPA